MADVKVCDRCSKILTGKMVVLGGEVKDVGPKKWWSILLRALDERYCGGWRETKTCNFDLCADCGNKLIDFITNKEATTENEHD